MSLQGHSLSPALVGGLLLRPVPLPVLRGLARPVLARAVRRLGPLVAERLEGLSGAVAVVPSGWPVAVVLTIGTGGLDAALDGADAAAAGATAVVRAPVEVLTGMLDGAAGLDGDASLFSRLLTIEGDTGLVMALRYALEDGGVDASSLLALLPAPLRPLLPHAGRLHAAAGRDLAVLQQALLAPLRADLARQEARVARLEQDAARRRR